MVSDLLFLCSVSRRDLSDSCILVGTLSVVTENLTSGLRKRRINWLIKL